MSYFVYSNRPTTNATIHFGHCGHCKNGAGQKKHTMGNANGEWSPKLKTFKDAKMWAKSTGHDVKMCGICKPY